MNRKGAAISMDTLDISFMFLTLLFVYFLAIIALGETDML